MCKRRETDVLLLFSGDPLHIYSATPQNSPKADVFVKHPTNTRAFFKSLLQQISHRSTTTVFKRIGTVEVLQYYCRGLRERESERWEESERENDRKEKKERECIVVSEGK